MRVYEMTHGDALVILKNKKSSRTETVKALNILLTFNDLSELRNLEKKELRRLIEFITEQKMPWEYFNSATKEQLILDLRKEYFDSMEDNCKKTMEINEAECYLRDYLASENHAKIERLSDAIETILWTLQKNRKRIVELEALTKDFQIGTVKHRHIGKKVK